MDARDRVATIGLPPQAGVPINVVTKQLIEIEARGQP